MIKKTLLSCILLVICWTLFTSYIWKKAASLQTWQDNAVAGENYIYGGEVIKNVMVGTSLANHIIQDSIPYIYKMTFSGLSIYDGLRVIMQRKTFPENVFIETNKIIFDEDNDFKDALFSPLPFYAKKYIAGLRTSRQPLSVMGSFIASYVVKTFYDGFFYKADNVMSKTGRSEAQRDSDAQDFFSKLLETKRQVFNSHISGEVLSGALRKLRTYVNELKAHGVNVIFFEMPINKELVSLPNTIMIRDSIHKAFPPGQYQYIPLPPDYAKYITTDGVHLTSRESEVYSGYFKNEASKFLK